MSREAAAEQNYADCKNKRIELEERINDFYNRDDDRTPYERSLELSRMKDEAEQARQKEHEARMELDQIRADKRRAQDAEIRHEQQMHQGHETPRTEEIRFQQWQEQKEREQKELLQQWEEENKRRMAEYLRQQEQQKSNEYQQGNEHLRGHEFTERQHQSRERIR